MSKIELISGQAEVIIEALGGVVESYQVLGRDIFYPRREIDGKLRGGSHVCAPYFGPGQTADQPQHGYGRVVDWQVQAITTNRVELVHNQTGGDYKGLNLRLIYELNNLDFTMQLIALNVSSQSLRLTPGFHPYFVSPSNYQVMIGEKTYDTRQVEGTAFYTLPSPQEKVSIDDIKLEFISPELRQIAIWTDRPDEYICIEPTLVGNDFSDNLTGEQDQYLASGQAKTYQFRLTPKDGLKISV